MQVHHLVHSDLSIKCTGCGAEFEVRAEVLTDPEALLCRKESIAAKHTCRTPRPISMKQVIGFSGGSAIERYWSREMRRLMPAQHGAT
jgi:hypothetical protein